jgi:hypothetical protein
MNEQKTNQICPGGSAGTFLIWNQISEGQACLSTVPGISSQPFQLSDSNTRSAIFSTVSLPQTTATIDGNWQNKREYKQFGV